MENLSKNANKKEIKYHLHYPNEISWESFSKDKINVIFIKLNG